MKKVILLIVLAFSLSINAQEKTNLSKTDEVLSKAVEKGIELAEKTGNFVIEQAPDLLKEFYQWHITESILGILLGVIIFLIGRYIPYLWIKNKESQGNNSQQFFNRHSEDNYYAEPLIPAYTCFICGSIASFIFIILNLYNLLYLLVAPKLCLIEYFIK